MASVVRGLVSKKKKRFQEAGYDLDLTYVTGRLIAMGFPSEGTEGVYRNPMDQVQRFFRERHDGHFRIFNLCCEREYDYAKFDGRAETLGFPDHNPCPFPLIETLCSKVATFLDEDPLNVVAIHCKAGKGRTGLMIACLLMYLDLQPTPAGALQYFGDVRTDNGKGVTIPSQARYVNYFHEYLQKKSEPSGRGFNVKQPPEVTLNVIRMHGIPNFDVGGGCDPYVIVSTHAGQDIGQTEAKLFRTWKKDGWVDLDFKSGIKVCGDFKIVIMDEDRGVGKDDKMCWMWLNTCFVTSGRIELSRLEIDGSHKDKKKRFPNDFRVEVCFNGTHPQPRNASAR